MGALGTRSSPPMARHGLHHGAPGGAQLAPMARLVPTRGQTMGRLAAAPWHPQPGAPAGSPRALQQAPKARQGAMGRLAAAPCPPPSQARLGTRGLHRGMHGSSTMGPFVRQPARHPRAPCEARPGPMARHPMRARCPWHHGRTPTPCGTRAALRGPLDPLPPNNDAANRLGAFGANVIARNGPADPMGMRSTGSYHDAKRTRARCGLRS